MPYFKCFQTTKGYRNPLDGIIVTGVVEEPGAPVRSRLEVAKDLASHYQNLTDVEVVNAVLADHKPSANPIVRTGWIAAGSLFVVFAAIGVVVPGWPTTSWLVAAAYAYGRSSQRLFRWLLTNRFFGELLLNYYRSGRSLPLHSKIVICGLIALVSLISIVAITRMGDPGFGQTTIALVAVIGIWWVGWRVPSTSLVNPEPINDGTVGVP